MSHVLTSSWRRNSEFGYWWCIATLWRYQVALAFSAQIPAANIRIISVQSASVVVNTSMTFNASASTTAADQFATLLSSNIPSAFQSDASFLSTYAPTVGSNPSLSFSAQAINLGMTSSPPPPTTMATYSSPPPVTSTVAPPPPSSVRLYWTTSTKGSH